MGEEEQRTREVVFVILEVPERQVYLVCTTNRGVFRGDPMMVGHSEVRRCIAFDPLDGAQA